MATVGVPLYLGEVAPNHLRGLFGALNQVGVVCGILLAQLVAALTAESLHWRFLLAMPAIAGTLTLLCRPLLPESPKYLLTSLMGEEAALASLRRLRAKGEEALGKEVEALRAEVESSGCSSSASLGAVFADRSLRLPLFVAFSMMVGQQWSGINAIFFYSTSFFADAGLEDPVLGTLLASTVNVISMLGTLPFMEKVGRRRLLLLGIGGMLVTAVVLTHVLVLKESHRKDGSESPLLDTASVLCVLLFVTAFEVGPGAIPWQIGAEIFPEEPRATAMGAAAVLNWVCNFIIGLLFPPMTEVLGPAVFVPFVLVLAAWFFVTFRYVPETKGKTIAQIQVEFAKIAGGEVLQPLKDVAS
uniref:Major facilitator superfamily (MFS) profile domain-containing protein n=1 Tax=Coccolithus braarudii TaxID=221442 RepID=A0A7S0Q473_9EUKA